MKQHTWPDGTLAITGAGMVSSLGLDIVTACAAARAGLVRTQLLDYFSVLSPDDFDSIALSVHQAPFVTNGFEGPMRLVRLLQAAFEDLINQTGEKGPPSTQTGFYLSLPDRLRVHTALDLVEGDDDRNALCQSAANSEDCPWSGDTVGYLLQQATKFAGWQGDAYVQSFTTSGHTGAIEAIRAAAIDLREKRIRCAIIGAVDSLVEETTLSWLDYRGRLKAPDMACGIQPGEAAAMLVVEPVDQAGNRDVPVLATLYEVREGLEPEPFSSGKHPSGKGLIDVIVPLMKAAECGQGQPPWFISDQNGEVYRAMEWGLAVTRLTSMFPAFARGTVWYPAASFGETGSATGALSLCLAARAFTQNYAIGKRAIILSTSDGPERAGLLIGKP